MCAYNSEADLFGTENEFLCETDAHFIIKINIDPTHNECDEMVLHASFFFSLQSNCEFSSDKWPMRT